MSRGELLARLIELNEHGPFSIAMGVDTDIMVTNEVVDKTWATGRKKITYQARILLDEDKATAFYWEMLKEVSQGLSFSFGVEKKLIKGKELFGSVSEKAYGLDGKLVLDYQFDYASMREAFKEIIEAAGWKFKLVLSPGKTKRAEY